MDQIYNQILVFTHASSTKHARHYAANFRFHALCRALAVRIISVWRPSWRVMTAVLANTKRARGREKRAKISPVIERPTRRSDMASCRA